MTRGQPVSIQVTNELLEMHNAGLTPKVIAEELPVSLPTVYNILRECGLRPNKETTLDTLVYEFKDGDVAVGQDAVDIMLGFYYKNVPLRKIRRVFGLKDNNPLYQALRDRDLPPRQGLDR